ncbi:hypothetical protein KPO26_000488 [Salmonella enterica]|nr:hypothetical protein [Salmonella enterica]
MAPTGGRVVFQNASRHAVMMLRGRMPGLMPRKVRASKMAWFYGFAVGTLCYLNCQANPGVQRWGTFLVAEIISFVFGVMVGRGIA